MAQVTVQQLAEVVGASVDRLLTQMKEAGLPHTEAEQGVSDEDKQTLLTYLKRSHGESTEKPKRITLKRKTVSELRQPVTSTRSAGVRSAIAARTAGAAKTVSVEVRRKRTYVKRTEVSEDSAKLQDAEAALRPRRRADGPGRRRPGGSSGPGRRRSAPRRGDR